MTMSLNELASRAEAICVQCATTPGLSLFQPIAASVLEVCRAAANLMGNHTTRMKKLAAFVVNETERGINGMAWGTLPLPAETLQILERVEVKLDEIRRTIERLPLASKKGKLPKYFSSARETSRLKKELEALVNELLEDTHKLTAAESSGISPAELANLTIRTAAAICEAPVLNFLKPVVGIAEIISETAQTVKISRAAALELAAHSSMVMRSIAEQATTLGLDGFPADSEVHVALKSVLSDIQHHLADLQKPRRRRDRLTSLIMANKKKDHIDEFNQRLDKALALFTSTNVLSTHAEVREIATLVRGNDCVEEIAIQVRMHTNQLTAMQTDLAVLVTASTSATVQSANEGEKKPNTTALVPFSTAVAQLTFFF
ncbi:hypothetical protein MSAN_00340600 [Mycena sanguinolenta]|uniref:Uncharacterized protein n=1 Tax=Mycena sanguinolenta TaxID=230812 RepID=A0A8H7DHJ0_9AGAR|nr:hypothetical protein MSAN_00340600 [Mycena sanguinolenta]